MASAPDNEVDVWLLSAEVAGTTLAAFESILDDREKARAAGARTADDHRRYVAAHGGARIVLGDRLGIAPDKLTWAFGEYGKPVLAGIDVHVNLTHSGDFGMVALCADRPVGVDIQQVMDSLDVLAMAQRYFAPQEAEVLSAAGESRPEEFARLWTRKEAVIKAAGGRLMRGLKIPVYGESPVVDFPHEPSPGAYRIAAVAAPPGYRAAVALAGPAGYVVTER